MAKLYLCVFGAILFCMLTFPLIAVKDDIKPVNLNIFGATKSAKQKSDAKTVKIYLSDEKKTVEKDISEYLIGVISCEMDETYESEALKAQTVAAHTLLCYRTAQNSKKDYDISDSSATDQGYLTPEKRKKKYGEAFANCEAMFKRAVNSVKDKLIYYKNKPILSVYHDTSGGKTESAKNVWGGDYPYLQSVESISDMLNPAYVSTVTYTKHEFDAAAKTLGITLPKKAEKYIGETKTTDCGTVKSMEIGNKKIDGQKIRTAFSLRSANFDLSYSDKKFVFTVRGFGHGVGMSQYGANFMAQSGNTYKDILNWYYTDCEIK